MPVISAIAAMTRDHVIGIDNRLPWHLPADLKHFRAITLGHPVIMGRKNYESIGKPLPGRTNIVVTSNANYQAPGCIVSHSPEEAIASAETNSEIFVIGGATLYKQLLPKTDKLYLTLIDEKIPGDTYFPEIDWDQWKQVSASCHEPDEKNPLHYTFAVYERKS